MARTSLTAISAPGGNATTGTAFSYTAADVANGNSFKSTGKEIVVAKNTDGAVAHTVTISSTADPYGRTGDVSQSIAANGIYVFGPFPTTGWIQSDGKIYLSGDNAALEFQVITLP